jgi:L-lactate dehydrogenase complex protein LldG
MPDAHQDIFDSIRSNLKLSAQYDVAHARSHADNHPVIAPEKSPSGDLTKQFCENLSLVGGKYAHVVDLSEASNVVGRIVADIGAKTIAISDADWAEAVANDLPNDISVTKCASVSDLFGCDVGITGAQWAIADTGTLVLNSEKERNRLTSLIPEVHICLLPAQNIRETMPEILEILHGGLSHIVTFITGPSRTSDIELTLAIGVHGPRELFVIIIDHI